jgi:hypothetical protein
MDQAILLIAFSAFAIVYAAGWVIISLPMDKRYAALNRSRLGIRRTVLMWRKRPQR